MHNKKLTQLWRDIKEGDMASFNKMYDECIDMLYGIGISYCKDHEYVKDCIHDLFFDIYKYRKKLSNVENVKSYLIISLKRKIGKRYKIKTSIINIDEGSFILPSSENSVEDDIIETEIKNEHLKNLHGALEQLSKKERKIISLRFEENMTYKEIAVFFDISVESSRTLAYRALKKIRENL